MTGIDDPWVDAQSGAIWVHGDLHVENFGTYLNSDGRLVFDINDFDEAYLGHFTWDLRRFAASLALMCWQKAVPEDEVRTLAATYLRALSNSNGKVGVIGHCSGGRQSFLAAVSLPLDAAVDCYGGAVVNPPPEGHPLHGIPALVNRAADLSCPLLGLFGREDTHPSPEEVGELEQALKANGKTYEFHLYDGAGHAFLQVDRPSYRPEAAVEAWQRIWDFYGRYL